MLGDTAEKSKNPLKKAMRRRNARTVQFSATPTYREASDYDYSSDEEDGEEQGLMNGGEVQAQERSSVVDSIDDDTPVAGTASNGTRRDLEDTNGEVDLGERADEVEARKGAVEQPRPSEESLIDKQCKGTIRIIPIMIANALQSGPASHATAQSETQTPSSATNRSRHARSHLRLVSSGTTPQQRPPSAPQTAANAAVASTASRAERSNPRARKRTRSVRRRSPVCLVACSRRKRRSFARTNWM